jgi:Holliday junction resolvase-like predicted endonuclease
MIGNQAVQRMLRADADELKPELTGTASPRSGSDCSRIPIHPSAAGVTQTKSEISKPGDEYEQEADRLAEEVMRRPGPQRHRACPCGGGCPKCQSGQPGREHKSLQSNGIQPSDTGQIAAPPIVHEVVRSPAQALDLPTRAFMEPRFGYDFSRVRVHTGAAAEKSAQDVNAHAYTLGRNIVFGAGRFAPGTQEGRLLIAHELAHVIQQGHHGSRVQRWPSCIEASLSARDCPQRESGEVQRAKAGLVFFNEMTDFEAARTGALIANFDIGRTAVTSKFKSMLLWKDFLQRMAANHTTYRLVGFSDCHEDAEGNGSLRRARAASVRQALPRALQAQVVGIEAAPAGECMRGNVNGQDRALNRSVALVQETTTINFSADEDNEPIVGKTPADHLRECQAGARVKTFPFRTTRFGGAPIMAKRDGDSIVVKMPMHVRYNDNFRREINTLPLDVFLGGAHLDPMEVVRVRHYELPHWYSPNITGDASGDKKADYCVPAEKLLAFASSTNLAFWFNVAATGVEALSVGLPVGTWVASGVSKLVAPGANAGRKLIMAGMLGARETVPVVGGVASRAPITLVGEVAAEVAVEVAVEQAPMSAAAVAASSAIGEVAVPKTISAAAVPQVGSSLFGSGLSSATAAGTAEVGGHALKDVVEQRELDAAFAPAGDFDEGLYETTQRLIRGNAGERFAAERLAADDHKILFFKPSILGTNQGGIDIVTIRNGVVNFIDNKALSSSRNVASVSSLTTNFTQNMAEVVAEFTRHAANPAFSQGEQKLFQEALDAIANGNYVRVVTNANIATTSVAKGVTERLASQGIGFIDVMPKP